MKKIIVKTFVLVALVAILLVMFYHSQKNHYEKVEITEKYYTPQSNGTAKGITSKKTIPIRKSDGKEACAMQFDNKVILEMDCEVYLNYSVGEKVKIKYDNHLLLDIRRK